MIFANLGTEFRKLDIENMEDWLLPPSIESTNAMEFHAEERCEEDEWFYIIIDEDHQSMISFYRDCFENTVSLNAICGREFPRVKCLFRVLEGSQVVFQKITPSKMITTPRKFLTGKSDLDSEALVLEEISDSIELIDQIDAYFDGKNRLYFKNFSRIKSLFKDILDYYREADAEDLRTFQRYSLFQLASMPHIGTRNLKMIANILDDDEIDLDKPIIKSKLLTEYGKYPSDWFYVNDGQFYLDNPKRLNNFLKLVLGRLYENPITGHKMESSHSKKI